MKKIFGLLVLVLIPCVLHAQAPAIEWEKCYGGTRDDKAYCIIQTSDGGYAIAGGAASNDFDVSGNHNTGTHDFWVVKTDAQGTIQWQKMLGGTDEDVAFCIIQTYDGGYVVSGETVSKDGDVDGYHGVFYSPRRDYWVVKLDSAGIMQWQKPLGGTADDGDPSVIQTKDSNYIIAGYTNSTDGDVTGSTGPYNIWIVKLDQTGLILWEKALPSLLGKGIMLGGIEDGPQCFAATSDGGFTVAGLNTLRSGDTVQKGIVVKLSDSCNIEWFKEIGGEGVDRIESLIQANDGGYALTGWTNSSSEAMLSHGNYDCWVTKLNSTGSVEWQKSYGGSDWDTGNSIVQTKDNGYAVLGGTRSSDGNVTGFHGGEDMWLIKLNTFGGLEWQKALGGSSYEEGGCVIQTKDGGFALAGNTLSNDGDVTGLHHPFGSSDYDYWVVKLMPVLDVPPSFKIAGENITLSPNPSNGIGKISYTLTSPSLAKIELFNPLGQQLRTLINSKEEIGNHDHEFDISSLNSGSYFFRIYFGNTSVIKGVVLMK